MSTPNPFQAPSAAPGVPSALPASDAEALRREHFVTESQLRSWGYVWAVTGGAYVVVIALALGIVLVAGPPLPAEASGEAVGVVAMGVVLSWYAVVTATGLALIRSAPGSAWIAVVVALLGVCLGPCGFFSVTPVGLLLSSRGRFVLSAAYAEVRAATAGMETALSQESPWYRRFGPAVLALGVFAFLVALVLLIAVVGAVAGLRSEAAA